jgi:RPA family protein
MTETFLDGTKKNKVQLCVRKMSDFVPTPPILTYIVDLVEGKIMKEGEEQYRWVLITTNGEKIYKARINGTIVNKYFSPGDKEKKAYTTLTVDDGTDTIRLKGWEEQADYLNTFEVGNSVDVMGKLRQAEEEIYILPDSIIGITDYNKEMYLRAKKVKRYAKKNYILPTEEQLLIIHNQEDKEKIWNLITDSDEGIELDDIITKSKLEKATVESVIQELIRNGDIYEPTSLKFKKI